MTDLRLLLSQAGVRTAVVIDDVFDAVPRPDELDDLDWPVFFDDLRTDGTNLLADLYPAYRETSPEVLKSSQQFITVLWENRDKLPNDVGDTLFKDYASTTAADRSHLDTLVATLEDLGLECKTVGRDVPDVLESADLIIVDLFLGFRQVDRDIETAIRWVKELVKGRAQSPPLVVLMSRSTRLDEKRDAFRDTAGLLGSMFRVVRKADLADRGRVETVLRRLADHYKDATRLAGFVHAWDAGLDQARVRFIRVLRRLDLSDIAQIRALLLEFEGQKLSEYLLDVADRVLQHEIEGDSDMISSAMKLNEIDVERYPPPHLTGSPDLQELVHRMVFLHSERLRLSGNARDDLGLQFGDVLRWTNENLGGDEVSLVVTPACDLVRGVVKRVMLLWGTLFGLAPKDWSYRETPVRTPIVVLPNGERKWIKWDAKDVRTLSWDELDSLFAEPARLLRIGRLREIYAIEIQQKMIAVMGRIGSPAKLPGSFPVEVALFYVGTDAFARRLALGQSWAAVCYVGRDKESKPVHKLVLTESACDEIERAVGTLNEDQVHPSARQGLSSIKEDRSLFARLERGDLDVPDSTERRRSVTADRHVLAVVFRGDGFVEGSATNGDSRKAGIIVRVNDI